MNYLTLPTYADTNGTVNVVVEICKGTYDKYEVEEHTGDKLICVRTLHKGLPRDCKYAYNYGFIPSTYAEDHDQLDAIILCEEKIEPLTVVKCKVMGVVPTIDTGEIDDKIICVPENSKLLKNPKLFRKYLTEAIKYLKYYKYPDQKATLVKEFLGPIEAYSIIDRHRIEQKQSQSVISKGDPFGTAIDRVNF